MQAPQNVIPMKKKDKKAQTLQEKSCTMLDGTIIDFPHVLVDEEGIVKKILPDLPNFYAFVQALGINIEYDVIRKEFDIVGADFKDSINRIHTQIASESITKGFKLSDKQILSYIYQMGWKQAKNPIADYLIRQQNIYVGYKTEHDYIKELADTLITDESEIDSQLKYELVKVWLTSCAYIVFNDIQSPRAVQGLLVLQGTQGVGKTTWIKKIIPPQFNKLYLKTGSQLDVTNKDSVHQNTKYWITELGELDGMTKKENEAVKAFFTLDVDELRLPYQVSQDKYPRRTCFYGTVNSTEFLTDKTGNRRYWTIPILRIDFEALDNIDLDMLWGQAMLQASLCLDSPTLPSEFRSLHEDMNESFEVKSPLDIALDVNFIWTEPKDKWIERTPSDILDKCGIKSSRGLKIALEKRGAKFFKNNKGRFYIVPPYTGAVYTNS